MIIDLQRDLFCANHLPIFKKGIPYKKLSTFFITLASCEVEYYVQEIGQFDQSPDVFIHF